ncbi:hypothetical protein [Frankia gtarii]|uniref:hypothetical protein n=1 Tax=Frankia gtarii TaxID=2950102 RepID=UPI0021C071E0|nr:hypothetical protein [Frankia gtarii]
MSIFRFGRVRGRLLLTAALLGSPLVVAGTFVASPPVFADEAPSPEHADEAAPDLSIEIDDGHTDVREGDRPTYTVKIRNIGTADASVPTFASAPPAASSRGADPPGGSPGGDAGS